MFAKVTINKFENLNHKGNELKKYFFFENLVNMINYLKSNAYWICECRFRSHFVRREGNYTLICKFGNYFLSLFDLTNENKIIEKSQELFKKYNKHIIRVDDYFDC